MGNLESYVQPPPKSAKASLKNLKFGSNKDKEKGSSNESKGASVNQGSSLDLIGSLTGTGSRRSISKERKHGERENDNFAVLLGNEANANLSGEENTSKSHPAVSSGLHSSNPSMDFNNAETITRNRVDAQVFSPRGPPSILTAHDAFVPDFTDSGRAILPALDISNLGDETPSKEAPETLKGFMGRKKAPREHVRKINYLRNAALILDLNENVIQEIAMMAMLQSYEEGDFIYHNHNEPKENEKGISQDDLDSRVYLVGHGCVELRCHLPNLQGFGEKTFMIRKKSGDLFGRDIFTNESSLDKLDGKRYATAVALTQCELIWIHFSSLIEIVDRSEHFGIFIAFGRTIPLILQESEMSSVFSKKLFINHPILWDMFRIVRLDRGEVLYRKGDFGKSMFVVHQGRLKQFIEESDFDSRDASGTLSYVSLPAVTPVSIRSPTIVMGKAVISKKDKCTILSQGSLVGETALLLKTARSATVIAEIDSVLLELGDFEFQHVLDNFPLIAESVTKRARQSIAEDLYHMNVSFLQTLNMDQLKVLAEMSTIVQIPPGEMIFEEGDFGDRFYIIVSGKVGIFVTKSMRKRIEICRLGRGSYFGELALINDAPRKATARAITHTIILSVTRNKFQEFMEETPEVGVDFKLKLAKYQVDLETFLQHPLGVDLLRQYCQLEYNDENLDFLLALQDFEKKCASTLVVNCPLSIELKMVESFLSIVSIYLTENAAKLVNLSALNRFPVLEKADFVKKNLEHWNSLPKEKRTEYVHFDVFKSCRGEIFMMMNMHIFPRFKNSPQFQQFLRDTASYDRLSNKLSSSSSDGNTEGKSLSDTAFLSGGIGSP